MDKRIKSFSWSTPVRGEMKDSGIIPLPSFSSCRHLWRSYFLLLVINVSLLFPVIWTEQTPVHNDLETSPLLIMSCRLSRYLSIQWLFAKWICWANKRNCNTKAHQTKGLKRKDTKCPSLNLHKTSPRYISFPAFLFHLPNHQLHLLREVRTGSAYNMRKFSFSASPNLSSIYIKVSFFNQSPVKLQLLNLCNIGIHFLVCWWRAISVTLLLLTLPQILSAEVQQLVNCCCWNLSHDRNSQFDCNLQRWHNPTTPRDGHDHPFSRPANLNISSTTPQNGQQKILQLWRMTIWSSSSSPSPHPSFDPLWRLWWFRNSHTSCRDSVCRSHVLLLLVIHGIFILPPSPLSLRHRRSPIRVILRPQLKIKIEIPYDRVALQSWSLCIKRPASSVGRPKNDGPWISNYRPSRIPNTEILAYQIGSLGLQMDTRRDASSVVFLMIDVQIGSNYAIESHIFGHIKFRPFNWVYRWTFPKSSGSGLTSFVARKLPRNITQFLQLILSKLVKFNCKRFLPPPDQQRLSSSGISQFKFNYNAQHITTRRRRWPGDPRPG